MKPSELFGVVVRMIGFLVILYGLWNVWAGFENIFENILPRMKAAMPTCLRLFLISRLVSRRWCWGSFVSSLPTGLSNWLTGILPNNAARLQKNLPAHSAPD